MAKEATLIERVGTYVETGPMSSLQFSSNGNRVCYMEAWVSPIQPSQNSSDIKYKMIIKHDRCVFSSEFFTCESCQAGIPDLSEALEQTAACRAYAPGSVA